MSTPQTETTEQRIKRETEELQAIGVIKKELPVITRSTFEALPLRAQADFMLAGGKYVDDPAPPKTPVPQGAMLRSTFDALQPTAQREFIKGGGSLVDDANHITPASGSGSVLTRPEFRELGMNAQLAFLEGGGTVTD